MPPTIMEIGNLSDLKDEVFGPVLHGLRFPRGGLDALVDAVNGTGYGLTFGIDSRIDETMARVTARDGAGNVCVNRDLIGAVVGAQPFGGHGLSGTGQGGWAALPPPSPAACSFLDRPSCRPHSSGFCRLGGPNGIDRSPGLANQEYTGWRVSCSGGAVGEENLYRTEPQGTVRCHAASQEGLLKQIGAALATGNRAFVRADGAGVLHLPTQAVFDSVAEVPDQTAAEFDAVLFGGEAPDLLALCREVASRPGPIVPIYVASSPGEYPLE